MKFEAQYFLESWHDHKTPMIKTIQCPLAYLCSVPFAERRISCYKPRTILTFCGSKKKHTRELDCVYCKAVSFVPGLENYICNFQSDIKYKNAIIFCMSNIYYIVLFYGTFESLFDVYSCQLLYFK